MKQKVVSCFKIIWTECKLVLRRVVESPSRLGIQSQSFQNLQAEVQIENDEIKQEFRPKLIFRQRLPYLKNKISWNLRRPLPLLSIRLQKSYFQKMKQDEQIIAIFSQLSAAYIASKQTYYYLQEVKLQGNRIIEFDANGRVEYSHIKFAYSSLKKQNSKFCLIITIYAQSVEEERVIIKSYICSEIFVSPFIREQTKRKTIKEICHVESNNCEDKCQHMVNTQGPVDMEAEYNQQT